ncbi:hypothetical protein DV453_001302 [Geotrichum candidum]|nr:hypothetical protein DV453_001302 [Geotrichum candidum]
MTDYTNWTKEDLIKRICELEEVGGSKDVTRDENATPAKKQKKSIDFSKFSTRHVAIRFAYVGWNYSGLAVQINDPKLATVEGEILKAMQQSKLIRTADPNDCDFSRCGRTDKGVSAFRQVISLRVRSLLTPEEQADPENDKRELDYLHILNQLLPQDIRLYEICLRPPEGFDARFSCTYRHYKYFFHAGDVNIELMDQAAKMFLGEHDFRNFCKVDGSKQISNFKRTVMSSSILKVEGDDQLFCFDLKGTAFLWHQVRSMIAILFLVGQGFEKPSIIEDLLDVEFTPRRPNYEMAADIPLVLFDCGFPEMEWLSFKTQDSLVRLENSLFTFWHEAWMKYTMISIMSAVVDTLVKPPYAPSVKPEKDTKVALKLGSGKGKSLTRYVPLKDRTTVDTPDVINQRWRKRKNRPLPGEVFSNDETK